MIARYCRFMRKMFEPEDYENHKYELRIDDLPLRGVAELLAAEPFLICL